MGETFSVGVRKEYSKRVFENEVLRRISGSNRDIVTEEWKKYHK
jgi:hypothetical protein